MKAFKNTLSKKLKLLIFFFSILEIYSSCVFATDDPLLLSPTEMQKLKQYFPNEGTGQHIVWNGTPISISLPLNQEKRLVFPQSITPDLKSALTTDQLRIINDHDSLYLTALKPFVSTRMFVTLNDANDVVMIDISTDPKADNGITYIDLPQKNTSISHSEAAPTIQTTQIDNEATESSSQDKLNLSGNDTAITLIRYAWQQLFAPGHLLYNPLNITRTPMHTADFVSDLVYGDKVIAHPLASWELNQTYVTAVELRNKYAHSTTLHLNRDICGEFQAATLYPRNVLKPAGMKNGDSTVFFVVSSKPFSESLEMCHGIA